MVPWPLRGWSNPALVAALLLARVACNVALTALVASARPRRDAVTASALTVASAVLSAAVVGGAAGRPAGLLELGVQVALLGVAAAALGAAPSRRRTLALGGLALLAVALALVSVVVYGEATVAP